MTNELEQHRRSSWQPPAFVMFALSLAAAPGAAAAAQRITKAELLSPAWSGGVTANTAFVPGSDAVTERAPFLGTLRLTEAGMTTQPAVFSPPSVLGRNPKLFPGVAISFFTDKGGRCGYSGSQIPKAAPARGHSFIAESRQVSEAIIGRLAFLG